MKSFDQIQSKVVIKVSELYDGINFECQEKSISFEKVSLEHILKNLDNLQDSEIKFVKLCYEVMKKCTSVNEEGKALLDTSKLSSFYLGTENQDHAIKLLNCSTEEAFQTIQQQINYDNIDLLDSAEKAVAELGAEKLLEEKQRADADTAAKDLAAARELALTEQAAAAAANATALQAKLDARTAGDITKPSELQQKIQEKIQELKSEKQQLKIQIKSLQQTPIKSTEQIEEEMSLKAKLKNLRTLGHLYKIQLGASNGHLESVRFKVKTTTDSEGRQTFVNQSGIEFIQEYLKQLEAKSWSDANDAIIKQEIINAKRALAGYLQPKSSAPLSELNPAHLSAGKSKQEQSAHTLTATAANAANSPRATRIVPPIHTSTTSGDIDYSFYLEQIAEKTVKDKTKNNVELKLGGLERRINQKDSRQNMLSSLASGNLGRMVDAVNLNRLNNQENDAFFEVSEERGAKITEKLQQIQENKKIKKLGIKSHIYDDTETRKITNQGNEKLIVTINDPKDHEIKGTTAATPPNTYEVSKTNDKDFTMTTNDPLDTIGDKMLVQWIETFKRTEGPNKVMVISDLFRDGQSLEEKTKAQEIANKIQQYCSSAGVTLKINSEPEPEPENTAASRHSPGRR